MSAKMEINPNDIRRAEEILIGGAEFDQERREFIHCMETLDLLAVPGSGKTTALLAKLYCIAQQMPLEHNQGILVLAHTNHAIEEIEKVLKPICPQLFSYPNFVGTVQSFANRFIANQACFELFGSYIRKNDDEVSNDELKNMFYNINYQSKLNGFIFNQLYSQFSVIKIEYLIKYFGLTLAEAKIKLLSLKKERKINKNGSCNYLAIKSIAKNDIDPINSFLRKVHDESITKFKNEKQTFCLRYKIDFIKSKFTSNSGDLSFGSESGTELLSYFTKAFKNGILRYSDSIALSLYYLNVNKELISILQNRFKYVFIDEMQDLDQDQVDMIENIFFNEKSNTVIQRVGDKNQAIYSNVSVVDEIVWKTRKEISPEIFTKNFSLNNSYRLSPIIANLVDGFVLDREEGYKVIGISNNQNLKPYLLVYDNESDADKLKDKFISLIKHHGLEQNSKNVERGFHIVAWTTDKEEDSDKWYLRKLFPEYSKESRQKKEDFDCLRKYVFLFDQNKKTLESIRKSLLNGIIRILRIEKIYIHEKTEKHYRKSSLIRVLKDTNETFYQYFNQKLFDWSYSIVVHKNYEDIFVQYSTFIEDELSNVLSNFSIINSSSFINMEYDYVATENFSNNKTCIGELQIKLGSIHSVKGQTHCATMYLETDYYNVETHKLNVEIVSKTKKRKQVLGRNPLFFQEQNFSHLNKARSNETLKMMYVGFSRPTDLLCFAVRKENVVNDLKKYRESGWNIQFVDDDL